MLRIVRRGDRHDPRELTVSFRFEGEFAEAFVQGQSDGLLPGETIKNMVHSAARRHGADEIESLALALAAEVIQRQPRISKVRVEIAETRWQRLEAGGKTQAQTFLLGSPEERTAIVTSNGRQMSVISGIDQLTVMRSAGFAPPRHADKDDGKSDGLQPLLVGVLSVQWTYASGDVTFGVYRQAVRNAVVETFAWHASQSVQHMLYGIADVVLSTCDEIVEITLAFHERPYRPADLFAAGTENPDELFVVVDEPLGVVEVTVERSA